MIGYLLAILTVAIAFFTMITATLFYMQAVSFDFFLLSLVFLILVMITDILYVVILTKRMIKDNTRNIVPLPKENMQKRGVDPKYVLETTIRVHKGSKE